MIRNDVIQLQPNIQYMYDPIKFILSSSANKSVLNIGATGDIKNYLPDAKEKWLHFKLSQVAKDITGVDIDQESVEYAAKHGFKIITNDCTNMSLDNKFDVIVFADVIEHLNAPGTAISTLMKHLKPNGKLIITTPNLTQYGLLIRTLLGKNLGVYYDHVTAFLPEHIQALCNRLTFSFKELYYFSHMDTRNGLFKFKSLVNKSIGRLLWRLNGSFLSVISHN